MKKTFTLIFSGCFTILALTSSKTNLTNSQGDKTGSSLSNNQDCATSGCHTPSGTRPAATIVVTDKNGQPATSFKPFTEYTVTIASTTTGGQTHFGVQACVLTATKAQAGVLSAPGSGARLTTRNAVQYLEHINPIANGRGVAGTQFTWTAPNTNEAVSIYAIINHVNNNNSTSGDLPTERASVTLTPNLSVGNVEGIASVSIYPNPATEMVNIDMSQLKTQTVELSIIDLTGKKVFADVVNISANKKVSIPAANLSKGVYSLHIKSGSESGTKLFSVK
jgi:hypothetical protein